MGQFQNSPRGEENGLSNLDQLKKEHLRPRYKNSCGSKPCPVCGMILSSTYNLTLHLRRHNNDKPFKCDKCPAAFAIRYELSSHAAVHSKIRPFKCKFCGKGFKNVGSLRTHFKIHGFKDHKCKYCALRFKSKEERFEHEGSSHNNDIIKHKCKFCYKSFADKEGLRYHVMDYHSKANIKKPLLQKNKEVGQDFKYYPCNKCQSRFKYKKEQISHYRQYHEDEFTKIFENCKICGKLLTKKYLGSHLEAHEGILPHKCKYCDYQSNQKNDLRNHQLTHTKNYQFKCSYCGKAYRTNSHVLLCEKRHGRTKDVKCSSCDMTFFTYHELELHTSSKHKLHKCSLCTFETTLKSKYYYHSKKHKNSNKPIANKMKFTCSKCGEKFPFYYNLRKHYKTHGDYSLLIKCIKQNICFYCDYEGLCRSDILVHCSIQHPDKVHQCAFCNYSTLSFNMYKNHIQIHANICKKDFSLMSYENSKDISECSNNSLVLECFICGFLSYTQDIMKTHIQTHSSELQDFSWYTTNFEEKLCFSFMENNKKCDKPAKKHFIII